MAALAKVVDIVHAATRRCRPPRSAVSALLSRATPQVELTSEELADLKAAVANVTMHDLDILPERFKGAAPDISYVHVAESPDLLMAVFVLPPGSQIPIHDHARMSVVSSVLWGELEVQSYDLLGSEWTNLSRERVAIKHDVSITPAGGVRVLTPTSGNVHSFHSPRHWTAVFDVAVPPYAAQHGRACHYYTPLDLEQERVAFVPKDSPQQPQERVFLKVRP